MFWNSTGYLDCICCLTRIRTLTGRSRNYSATITPWDNTFLPLFNVWKAHSDCLPVLLPALWCKITKIILYNNAFSKNKNRLNFIFEIQPITLIGCLTKTRTWSGRTKNCSATITPWDNRWALFLKRCKDTIFFFSPK